MRPRFRLTALLVLISSLAAVTGGASSAQSRAASIFQPQGAARADLARNERPGQGPARRAIRARRVAVDFDLLAGAAAGGRQLALQLFDDTAVTAARERIDRPARGRYVWSGRIVDGGEGLVTLAVNGDVMSGQVWIGADLYEVEVNATGEHSVTQVDPAQFPPETAPLDPPNASGDVSDAPGTFEMVAADEAAQIDVMVVYTAAARLAAGGTSAMVAKIDAALANANTAYASSGVTQRIRLVHTEEVPYTESGSFNTDLLRLTSASDGYMDNVHSLRNTSGADFVSLLVSSSSASCGIAWLMSSPSHSFAANAFSVTEQSCAAGNLSLAHELGHNMGLHHDVANAGGAQGATPYAFGYQHPGLFRTVMAYACTGSACGRVMHFSTHTRSYAGAVTGVAGASENARVLNETLPFTRDFRPTVVGALPTLAASPGTLKFGAVTSGGGVITTNTPAQEVVLTQSGTGSVTWTAVADQPWIQVLSGSGTGSGRFTVRVISSNVLPPSGEVVGHVNVTASGAQAGLEVRIEMRITSADLTGPIGSFDSPADQATGIVGSIGVTGWALDDIGVRDVNIYRSCVPADVPTNCQPIGPDPFGAMHEAVFVGKAVFLPGARPDVAAAFASHPDASRGGWGYLMLTNMLPDVPANRLTGGQGALSIHAVAVDLSSNATFLGTKTISLDNANATKPFGAIDTPAQGATVSGLVGNFGWALTPGTAQIPNANAIFVFIDAGTPDQIAVPVTYNQCRGTVGNPAPVGGCDDDIAALFPTYTNIVNAGGAIGSYVIDTTRLSNGLHTIAWSVIDDQGRIEGIGSRFFIVQNGGS